MSAESSMPDTNDAKKWEEEDELDYDEEDDEELDAEAEEIARKLWADISRAQPNEPDAVKSPVNAQNFQGNRSLLSALPSHTTVLSNSEAIKATAHLILNLLAEDKQASDVVSAVWLPPPSSGTPARNLLEILRSFVTTGHVDKGLALPLSKIISDLAQSDTLFPRPGHTQRFPPTKRKRDNEIIPTSHSIKRPRLLTEAKAKEFQDRITTATNRLLSQLSSNRSSTVTDLFGSLQTPLQEVFTFAVSSSRVIYNPLEHDAAALQHQLQEISGFIQVLGVLCKAPFTENPELGTIMYPCAVPMCGKTFHDRRYLHLHNCFIHAPAGFVPDPAMSVAEEEMHVCQHCQKPFARVYDFQRHSSTHSMVKVAYKCSGCTKLYSRLEAAERHISIEGEAAKDGSLDSISMKDCCGANIEKILHDPSSSTLTTKWYTGPQGFAEMDGDYDELLEDGELSKGALAQVYGTVLGLHQVLKQCVATVSTPSSDMGSSLATVKPSSAARDQVDVTPSQNVTMAEKSDEPSDLQSAAVGEDAA